MTYPRKFKGNALKRSDAASVKRIMFISENEIIIDFEKFGDLSAFELKSINGKLFNGKLSIDNEESDAVVECQIIDGKSASFLMITISLDDDSETFFIEFDSNYKDSSSFPKKLNGNILEQIDYMNVKRAFIMSEKEILIDFGFDLPRVSLDYDFTTIEFKSIEGELYNGFLSRDGSGDDGEEDEDKRPAICRIAENGSVYILIISYKKYENYETIFIELK